ncbi:hypothetical protein X727_32445 [Mesorhizobium sp. L103C119B0]|nr:hypothetical protein X727_32445 [Mesorhizobium sp. L103C119B0]
MGAGAEEARYGLISNLKGFIDGLAGDEFGKRRVGGDTELARRFFLPTHAGA